MEIVHRKEFNRLIAASFVLFLLLGFSYFAGNGGPTLNFKSSVEIGVSSLSPRGSAGGFIIPASCPSYEHVPGECTPAPTADIRVSNVSWVSASDGPLDNQPNPSLLTISWHTSGGIAYTCNVTKNSGPCQLTDGCTASNVNPNKDPATANNTGSLGIGSYNYTILCTDTIGRTASDVVYINVGSVSSRYICGSGICTTGPGPGPNTGNCNATKAASGDRCSLTQCNDGIDNDNNGKIDFPKDLGCISFNDNYESNIQGIFKECDPGLETCN